MKKIDARKLACPAPVLMAKEAIETDGPDAVVVLVDNEAACQNVSRFFKSRGYAAAVNNGPDGFEITGTKGGQGAEPAAEAAGSGPAPEKRIMVMITADRMGEGDEALGRKLMTNFIHTLNEMGPDLWRLVMVNSGVKLAAEGADVLPALQVLESGGLEILVCGTCLDHYGLLDKKRAGQTTNMLDIVTAMQLADQVINI